MANDEKNWHRGKGHGYVTKSGRRALIRCPECGRENHVMHVIDGVCCWCGHDENAVVHEGDSLVAGDV